MRHWLLILLLLCAPLSPVLAHCTHAVAGVAGVAGVTVASADAVESATFAVADASAAVGGLDADPCHTHAAAMPPPGSVDHAGRGAAPRASPWRPSDGHSARPERPDWPSRGATRLRA